MSVISVSYIDHESGDNFEFTKEIRNPHISDTFDTMIDIIRLIGFPDELIDGYIREAYFDDPIYEGTHEDGN